MSSDGPSRRSVRLRGWAKGGVVANAVSYSAESAVRLALTALVGVLIARYLGPDGLGLLSYATSVFALLAPLALLGMRSILVREFSTVEQRGALLVSALVWQLPAAVLASVAGFAVVAATRGDQNDAVAIAAALAPLPLLAVGDTFRALFEATERVKRVVVVGLLAVGIASVAKLVAIVAAAPIWVFAALTSVESLLVLLGLVVGLRGQLRSGSPLRRFDRRVGRDLITESWPLLVGGLAVMLYMRADIVMLGLLADDETTGIYVAAARLSEVWYFLPVAAMAAMRPRLARQYASGDLDGYEASTQLLLSTAFVVATGAIVVTLALGGWLIETLYGVAFAPAATVLRIHILAAPFVFLGVTASQWFVDRGMTRAVMIRSGIGALTNIALNVVLIPAHGAGGAAVATLISYAVSGVLFNGARPRTRSLFMMQARAFLPGLRTRNGGTGNIGPPTPESDEDSEVQEDAT